MFSSKLRSWMEAVRPRKKQQRKDKQKNRMSPNSSIITHFNSISVSNSTDNGMDNIDNKSIQTIASHGVRYSAANLSSPESAYSTGYSTDGTSPGVPPRYYINMKTGTQYFSTDTDNNVLKEVGHQLGAVTAIKQSTPCAPCTAPSPLYNHSPRLGEKEHIQLSMANADCSAPLQDQDNVTVQSRTTIAHSGNLRGEVLRIVDSTINSGITSPRQRNRIRTNPWVPGNTLSPSSSCIGLLNRQDVSTKNCLINSPVAMNYLSPTVPCSPINHSLRCESLSSSSCSSLSGFSLNWNSNIIRDGPSYFKAVERVHSTSDEDDDCTLNEMMGKFDESYVYEKETDILSDSDPTDCDTDIDTGQDGGDEDDALETEFDFIDNGSLVEFNIKGEHNTGHCTYYNFEIQRKSFKRKTTRRSQKELNPMHKVERRQSSSTRSRCKDNKRNLHSSYGTKSAGATPISVRRTKPRTSKLILENQPRKRSNSISSSRDPVHFFDQRDKEADKKYKELIVEAEHILNSMNSIGLSPRRVPGPTNKRVELLRTESTKSDIFMKNKLIEDVSNLHVTSRIPSNLCSRYSPKRNHITKFINNNSPILLKRETNKDLDNSPLSKRTNNVYIIPTSSVQLRKKPDFPTRRSPKYRKKISKSKLVDNISSDSEEDIRNKLFIKQSKLNSFGCPQSEPVRRKIYSNQSKAVTFNFCNPVGTGACKEAESIMPLDELKRRSETMRQHFFLRTIVNLKRSLEDQSASLQQAYKSSHNLVE